ncbi:MAG: ERAP1-like C-terminal domain-containing protein, partial [Chloroflexi bacterium]|nr:ERAP1-like C-terminal domain-containing protein [Chloroflexota bacterium]
GNASLHDFLGALEEGSGRNLGEWSRLWLETSSLNTIRADWESDGERVTRLELSQTAPADYPTIRPHTLETGLLTDDGAATAIEAVPAVLEGESTEIEAARGQPRPALVYPNFNDHAYAKIALDDESVAWARENIERVGDDLLRQQLWSTLWSMVRDQQLKSTDFLAIVREKIGLEQNIELVDSVLGHAASSQNRYVPAEQRDAEAHLLFETAREGLLAASDNDTRIIWGRALVGLAVNPDDLAYVGHLADGEEVIAGFELDQDMRWGVAARHVAFGLPGAAERVAAEAERDPSDRGQRAQLRCQTAVPDASVKADAWERFNGEGYGSRYLNQAAMSGFNWTHQADLLAPYVDAFFDQVGGIFVERDREFATVFYGGLFPSYRVEQDTLDRAQALLDETPEEQAVLQRMLREAIDDLGRAIACREFATS